MGRAAKRSIETSTMAKRFFSKSTRNLKWLLVLCLFVLLWSSAYLALFTTHLDDFIPGRLLDQIVSHEDLQRLIVPANVTPSASRRLRLFMPADNAHINLCKSIMSAVALGYPVPTLLNWAGEYNRPNWHFAGSHIAKLESLLGALDALEDMQNDDPVRDDDLVLLVDAYDIWFQLPPSVLIERYHQLNREADERIRREWPDGGFPIPPPRQEIIVTTAKDCFPDTNSGSNPHYTHWPASPAPDDLYGKGTDQIVSTWDPARKYRKIRPRCVNSGMIMGTVGALREVTRRAADKVDLVTMKGRQLWSDQALLGEIIGEQEMWREWVQSLASSWNGIQAHHNRTLLPRDIRTIADAALQGHRFEFGIGLDYNFTTIPPTCSAEEDGAFVPVADYERIADAAHKAGVPDGVRIRGLPRELRGISDPDGMLADVRWANEPLYTDLFFGVIPVGIHHNAYVNGLKPWRLQHWWEKMWFHARLRELVTRRLKAQQGARPLARVSLPGASRSGEVVYWAPREDYGTRAVRVFEREEFHPVRWDDVCQRSGAANWYDELFGDEKGPLDI